ncbi:MAG: response regulator [Planctomycetota bacterium]
MNHPQQEVLIVDDDENLCRSLVRNLEPLNLNITYKTSGHEAIEWLKHNQAAIIIADYSMPEMNGFEFLEYAQTMQPDTKRIILTAKNNLTKALNALENNLIERYVTKPWDPDKFRKTIRRLVNSSRNR